MQIRPLTPKYFFSFTVLVVLSFTVACSNNDEQKRSGQTDKGSQLIMKSHKAAPSPSPSSATKKNARIFSSISPNQAYQMLQSRNDILFLDVRSLREREQFSIPGSNYLPIGAIFKGTVSLPQDKAILLFCAVGGRSYAAAKILSARGQHEVYNLKGGIEAWAKAGLPVLSGGNK